MRSKLTIPVILLGWLLFAAWLSCDYVEYRNKVFIHIFQESFSYEKIVFYVLIILAPFIYTFLGFMINERLRLPNKLESLEKHHVYANTDELTNLLNRIGFSLLVEQQLKIANRKKKGMLIVYIDINNLKKTNSTLGQKAGDMALVDAANIIKNTFRVSDIIARIGEDEFAVLAIDSLWAVADIFAIRLNDSLKKFNREIIRPYKIHFNIGFSNYDPLNPSSLEELISKARRYLEEEKQGKEVKEILGID
ncbi:MAG: GGDEF domain-containing protein [Thermodesulfovibrionales bacterium]